METDRRPKIRFINTYEPVSRHYRDLIPVLIQEGWEVEVLISCAQYRSNRDRDWIRSDIKVTWMPNLGLKPQGILGKAAVMLTYTLFGAVYMLFGPRVDINLFLTQPPLFSLWGYVLKRLRGQKLCQIVMDIYPDMAVELGLMKRGSLWMRVLTRLSRFSLRRADQLIAIGRCMKEKLISFGVSSEKIVVIPNWVNAEYVRSLPHEENPFRAEHGWQDKFVLMFAGNIGIPQYFDDILQVCQTLNAQCPNFIFALIGDGVHRADIEAYKIQHRLESIVFLPYQPPRFQTQFLSAADVHFVSLKAGMEGLAVPSKTYSILGAGRPIVYQGSPSGEIARFIGEEDIGTAIPLQAAEALKETILKYKNDHVLRTRQGHHARALADTTLSHETICQRYVEILSLALER